MPAEIVNLNKFRKAKERAEQEKQAEQNRAKFGRTKVQRISEDDEQARRDKLLDDVKLTAVEPNTGSPTEPVPDSGLDPSDVS